MQNFRPTTLGELCTGNGGTIQTGPFGSQLHRSDYKDFGVPVIMPTNIRDGRVTLDGIAYIAEADAERLTRHRAKLGDIIFSRRGEVDKCAVVTDREAGWLCGTGCLLARPNLSKADPNYVGYHINFDITRLWLRQHAVGLVMPNLNTGILSRIPLAAPMLSEQRKIAAILSAIDDKIELNRRMNETLEASARALFRDWFVDFGPTRAKAEGRPATLAPDLWSLFPDRLGDNGVPEGWSFEALGEVTNELRRGLSPAYLAEGGICVLNQKCIRDTSINLAAARRHDSQRKSVTGRLIEAGDILVNSTGVGTLGRVAQIWHLAEPTIVDSHVTVVRANPKRVSPYVLGTGLLQRQAEIEALGEGSTGQTELSRARLGSLQILVPVADVQQAFDRLVKPFVAAILANQAGSRTLAATRDALLPKLMSGELRVRDAEALAA